MHGQSRRQDPSTGTPLPSQNREMKARQCAKIWEIGEALCAAGYVTLDKQAEALGLARSTAWTVLRAGHKASGLTVAVLERMLASPSLPAVVHQKLLEYVAEKSAGLYGHCAKQWRRFLEALSARVVRAAQNRDPAQKSDSGPCA